MIEAEAVLEKMNKHEIKKIFQLGSFPAASRVRDLGTLGSREGNEGRGDKKELQRLGVKEF